MSKSRRRFLAQTSVGLLGAAVASRTHALQTSEPPPGAPPAFGTAPPVGPEVSPSTFAEAEKLVQVQFTSAENSVAARTWRNNMAALYERRTGPRKAPLDAATAPWSRWDAALPGDQTGPERDRFVRSKADPGPLPAKDEDVAFAPLTQLARWVETRKISSERLTNLYLERLERFNSKLRCVITLT